MWLLFSFLSAITAALVAIFGKIGLKDIDSTLATTLRSVVMAVFLILTSASFGKFNGFSFKSLESKNWFFIALSGIVGALSWLFYFLALKYGLTSRVVAIDRLSLVFAVILAIVFLGEKVSWSLVVGIVLMVSGALLISLK